MTLTKGIIEQIIDKYSVRLRIPTYNRSSDAILKTPTEDLPVAHICVAPGIYPNYKVGDIIYVGFEDNQLSQPIILGYLYREGLESTGDMHALSLQVDVNAFLPRKSSIGNVTPTDLSYLNLVKSNIQQQIDQLESKINP